MANDGPRTKQLAGKRSGRPPGARGRSPLRVDVAWVYRNIGDLSKPHAVVQKDLPQAPRPSTLVLWKWAREHWEKFFSIALRYDDKPGGLCDRPGTMDGDPALDGDGSAATCELVERLIKDWDKAHEKGQTR